MILLSRAVFTGLVAWACVASAWGLIGVSAFATSLGAMRKRWKCRNPECCKYAAFGIVLRRRDVVLAPVPFLPPLCRACGWRVEVF